MTRSLAVKMGLGLGAVALILAGVLMSQGVNPSPGQRQGGLQIISVVPAPVNRPAPNLTLPLLGGRVRESLSSLKGRVVVLNFWASWCVACRSEAAKLQALWIHYRGLGVVFLGVDVKDTTGAALAFNHRYGVTYPSIVDATGSSLGSYGIFGLPDTYLIDRAGHIRYTVVGAIDPVSFRSSLDRMVSR